MDAYYSSLPGLQFVLWLRGIGWMRLVREINIPVFILNSSLMSLVSTGQRNHRCRVDLCPPGGCTSGKNQPTPKPKKQRWFGLQQINQVDPQVPLSSNSQRLFKCCHVYGQQTYSYDTWRTEGFMEKVTPWSSNEMMVWCTWRPTDVVPPHFIFLYNSS